MKKSICVLMLQCVRENTCSPTCVLQQVGGHVFPLSMAGVWENLIIPLIQQAKLFICPCSSFLADTHRTTWNSGHTDASFSFQQAFFQCCRVILGHLQPHGEPTELKGGGGGGKRHIRVFIEKWGLTIPFLERELLRNRGVRVHASQFSD